MKKREWCEHVRYHWKDSMLMLHSVRSPLFFSHPFRQFSVIVSSCIFILTFVFPTVPFLNSQIWLSPHSSVLPSGVVTVHITTPTFFIYPHLSFYPEIPIPNLPPCPSSSFASSPVLFSLSLQSPITPPVFSLHGPEFVPGYNGADYRRQRGTAPRRRREPDASSWTLPTRPTACSGRSNTEKGNCKQNPSKDKLPGWVMHTYMSTWSRRERDYLHYKMCSMVSQLLLLMFFFKDQ